MRRRRRRVINPERRRTGRALFISVFFCFCLIGLLYRIYHLQSVYGEEYTQEILIQESLREIARVSRITEPSRGEIRDRNHQPIAGSRQVFTVTLDVDALHTRHNRNRNPERDIRNEVLSDVIATFGISRIELEQLFNTDLEGNLLIRRQAFILSRNVAPEVALPLAEIHPEIHAEEVSQRFYHDAFFAPQVIGFIRGDTIWGLESQYNRMLEGERGRTFWVQGEVEEIPVRDGHTLITTLDGDIQRLAQFYVDRTLINVPSDFVAIIVMQPDTGEILAMAQAPTFSLSDPWNHEIITDTALQASWPYMTDGERQTQMMRLWRNFSVTRSFEPGSTFKPFVIAAAIEEGVIPHNHMFYCRGYRTIYDHDIDCWQIYGHGHINLTEALKVSCNIAMIDINRMLGRDVFYRYRGYFGFGERTGIDMPGEEAVSSPAVMYTLARLNPVEMATSSMGQGFNSTAIQLINGFASLINGGNVMQPFFVSQIVDNFGNIIHENRPTVVRRAISPYTSEFIRHEMQHVVHAPGGTGWRSAVPGHAIGGKTGTAQQGADRDGITLSYIAYTPVSNPEFLVLMVIDNVYNPTRATSSGAVVAPIVGQFFEDLIRLRNLQPSDGPYAMERWEAARAADEFMPDFSGRRLADVVRNASYVGRNGYQVVGPPGTIISHTVPAPGMPMPQNSAIQFHMLEDTRIAELMTIVPDIENLSVSDAQFFLNEAGLPSRVVQSQARGGTQQGAHLLPFTAQPILRSPDTPPPVAPVQYVYRQFPRALTELERGTEVILRVR